MICPRCNEDSPDQVLETRAVEERRGLRRRRKCHHCGYKWTTFEIAEDRHAALIKFEKLVNALERVP